MAILHLVRCDSCGKDTLMHVSVSSFTMSASLQGQMVPIPQTNDYSVPSSIKQVDGRHFCSWPCVAGYADKQVARGAAQS